MRKEIALLVTGILFLSLTGCSGREKPGMSAAQPATGQPAAALHQAAAVPVATQQAANSNPDAAGSSSLYDQSLVFPDGKVITSDIGQIGYGWKGLGVQLCTMWAYPVGDDTSDALVRSVLGNHVVSFSQKPVTLGIGPAVLVSVDRDMPAASGDHAIYHECWLIVFHPDPPGYSDRQIAYTMQARCGSVAPGPAAATMLELAKGWKIPALQVKSSAS